MPFFKEINDRMIKAIENSKVKDMVHPSTAKTFEELIDEL